MDHEGTLTLVSKPGSAAPTCSIAENAAMSIGMARSRSLGSSTWKFPSQNVMDLLKRLISNEQNIVYLMSGRKREDLTEFFDVRNLGLRYNRVFNAHVS